MVFLKYLENFVRGRDYSEVQESLYKIREPKSVHRYVAKALLYSILIAVFSSLLCFTVSFFLLSLQFFYAIGLSLIIGVALGFSIYRLFLYYPHSRATNRKKEIDDMLPHATAFMLALSKGGLEPIDIFESLSDKAEYGEIAKEAGAIARNAKILGYSPTEAIEEVADTTPSTEFRDFLTSFSSVIETGADIPEFLSRRAERYYEWMEEKQEENLEFLGVLSEVYVITLGLGPIFGIVILILFGMMGTFMPNVLNLIIYIFIPLGTAAFVVILDMQSRTSFGESQPLEKDVLSEESNSGYIDQKIEELKSKLGDFQSFVRKPMTVLWLTIPVGVLVFYLIFFAFGIRIETAVTFFALVSLSPLAVLYEVRRRRNRAFIKLAPDFLNSFSDALSSGLSPSKAIFFLTPGRYGRFKSEIEKMRRDIEWGSSVSRAFGRAADRIESGIISHVMALVRKSTEMATDITSILEILSEDVSMEKSLQQERTRITSTYVIIVILTFVIFLLIAYSLTSSIVPLMGQMSQSGVEGGEQLPMGDVGEIDPSVIELTFFHASLIHGFFSGLLAGMLRTGKLSAGLKYSMILLGIAWAFFTLMGI